ncbi:MAG: 2-phosphosulfolactate phosphatase [Pseudomonadales bacterium]|jgi:2-phosphosulfolactate phosphatase
MIINKLDFVNGAQQAEGIAVIIDVFRAFSVACYCYYQGVHKVIPMGSLDDALLFEQANTRVLKIGERNGRKPPEFDFGNSPTEIMAGNVNDAIMVQTTHAGTQGLVNAHNASEVLTGALVNAKATIEYIKRQNPAVVSLVRMGHEAAARTDEDDICADYMEALLLNKPFDIDSIRATLLNSPCAQRFLDPAIPWNPMSDFDYCTDVDRFNFALTLITSSTERPYLEKTPS